LFFFLVSPPAHAQMPVPLEYQTKAYFLAQFPRFIDWPDTAFPSAPATFLICILGESSLGPSLVEFTRGTVAQGRRVEVRWARPERDLRACQILFISRSKRKQFEKDFEVVHGSTVQGVIALTAHAMKGDRERCMAAGMDGYLSKPIRPQELDAILESYVGRRMGAMNTLETAGRSK
jgi:hypothetical protein